MSSAPKIVSCEIRVSPKSRSLDRQESQSAGSWLLMTEFGLSKPKAAACALARLRQDLILSNPEAFTFETFVEGVACRPDPALVGSEAARKAALSGKI